MMMAPIAGILKVNGSSMAIAVTGPMPGSTPTRVPMAAPARQYSKFAAVIAT